MISKIKELEKIKFKNGVHGKGDQMISKHDLNDQVVTMHLK